WNASQVIIASSDPQKSMATMPTNINATAGPRSRRWTTCRSLLGTGRATGAGAAGGALTARTTTQPPSVRRWASSGCAEPLSTRKATASVWTSPYTARAGTQPAGTAAPDCRSHVRAAPPTAAIATSQFGTSNRPKFKLDGQAVAWWPATVTHGM